MRSKFAILLVCLLSATHANAWDPAGHQLVGDIAQIHLNDHARQKVAEILGFELGVAGPWMDCLRSEKVDNAIAKWADDPKHWEWRIPCQVFLDHDTQANSGPRQRHMEHYVLRNPVHGKYHYTSISILRDHYEEGFPGADDQDIVHAIKAAVAKLKGEAVPAPFQIDEPADAVLMLAHLIGDIHQPLHVGTVYLDESGKKIDPKDKNISDGNNTVGGNALDHGKSNLHAEWDGVSDLTIDQVKSFLTTDNTVAPTAGPIGEWAL